jgi:exocyst complex protein 7
LFPATDFCSPEKTGLEPFLSSVKRVNKALVEMRRTNLRSNQQAVADLSRLLKSGNLQLENQFQKILQSDSRPIEPLQIIMKAKPFPLIDPDKMRLLGMINKYIAGATKQSGMVGESSPVLQTYANVRGPYLTSTLQNLAARRRSHPTPSTDAK